MKLLKRLRLWLFMLGQKRYAAKQDADVCCCGDMLPTQGYCSFGGGCRSQVEYYLTCVEARKREELGL